MNSSEDDEVNILLDRNVTLGGNKSKGKRNAKRNAKRIKKSKKRRVFGKRKGTGTRRRS